MVNPSKRVDENPEAPVVQSLYAFSKSISEPRSSVKAWLNGRGFDTSKGLTQDAVDAAMAHYKPPVSVDVVEVETVTPYAPGGVTVSTQTSVESRSLSRIDLQEQIGAWLSDRGAFAQGMLAQAAEQGRQLGHQMMATEISTAMQTHKDLQTELGQQLGVVKGVSS